MRKVVYGGAMSLDGYIAGPNGEYDWIVMDPGHRLRRADGPVRHVPDRPQDVRGDAQDGRRRRRRRRASGTSSSRARFAPRIARMRP